MAGGHGVDLERLTEASQAIIGCIPQRERTDLESISGDGEWYGHGDVFGAFSRFCTTWQLATEVLSARAASAASALAGVAQGYAADDADANRSMKRLDSDLSPF